MKRPEPELSLSQRKIVNEIKRLYQRGEPLNICAVKRRHPELLRDTYAVQPFWGWKRALKAAGVEYPDIKVELLDTVICEICHRELRAAGSHFSQIHGIDKHDYQIDYPGAEMASEQMRADGMGHNHLYMKHWEAPWTPEYVLDRVAELRDMGVEVNAGQLSHREGGFVFKGALFFGSWSNALRAVGIDPVQELRERKRKQRRYPTPEAVVAEIQRRANRDIPFNCGGVSIGKHRDPALWATARNSFGSWNQALRVAGMDVDALLRTRTIRHGWHFYPDRHAVIKEIRKRRRQKMPNHYMGLKEGPYRDKALLRTGKRLFGSWSNALRAVGIDPVKELRERKRKQRRYPTRAIVVAELKRRVDRGIPSTRTCIVSGEHRDPALWVTAREYFGSWSNALRAVGIDLVKEFRERRRKRRRYPTQEAVVAELKRRIEQNLPINYSRLVRGEHRDVALLVTAKESFGSWNQALRVAGMDVDALLRTCTIRHGRHFYPDRHAVIKEIRKRRRQKMPNYYTGLAKGPYRDKALLRTGKRLFGSWSEALSASGLKPSKPDR